MNTFKFIGKLVSLKDTDNFKGYEEKVFDSGWMNQKLKFMVVAGDNAHFVEINAGKWKDDKKNSTIYTRSRATEGKPSENIQVPWDKRNDPKTIEGVAGNRIFTIDTDTYAHRQELKENGETEALEASNKKRRHFLAGTDFCDYARKVVGNEKAQTWMFKVSGNIITTYGDKNGMYYSTYEVTKITRVNDDTEPLSETNFDFLFTEGVIDTESVDETGRAIVNGYSTFYDNNTKKNWCYPITFVLTSDGSDKGKKRIARFEEIFNKFEDDEVRKIGLICTKINGAQKSDIKFEDLDEDTQLNIECGLIDLEDAVKSVGGQLYGDRIQEIRIEKLGRNYSKGSETTSYTIEDLQQKPHKEEIIEEDIDGIDDDI